MLEKTVDKTGLKITSPDYLIDKTTGNKREVDISIKGKFGSHDILVIIECRDRKNIEDVTWIEQIAIKREDVGANKAVAVSSFGFSSGAREKARAKNIGLRTIEEIARENVLDWFAPDSITYYNQKFQIKDAKLNPLNQKNSKKLDDFLKNLEGKSSANDKIFFQQFIDEPLSLNDLFYRINNFQTMFINLKPGQKTERIVQIFPENKNGYKIQIRENPS